VGFEPTEPYGSRALQARAFGQTTQPLRAYCGQIIPFCHRLGKGVRFRCGVMKFFSLLPRLCYFIAHTEAEAHVWGSSAICQS
jgi:hypothetical protein